MISYCPGYLSFSYLTAGRWSKMCQPTVVLLLFGKWHCYKLFILYGNVQLILCQLWRVSKICYRLDIVWGTQLMTHPILWFKLRTSFRSIFLWPPNLVLFVLVLLSQTLWFVKKFALVTLTEQSKVACFLWTITNKTKTWLVSLFPCLEPVTFFFDWVFPFLVIISMLLLSQNVITLPLVLQQWLEN